MKSSFTLWGPKIINGEKRWGVNEKRDYGTYTYGPHDGYYSRKDAQESLLKARAEERANREAIAFNHE
jgi:hypothetical protein